MSGDEVAVLIASAFLALFGWIAWYARPVQVRGMRVSTRGRPVLYVAPLVALLLIFAVLRTAASFDVRDDPRYLLMYTVLGAAWVAAACLMIPLLGVSPRDDVAERGNVAAAWATAGAVLGFTVCYAGGNIGDGPGWWVVVFSAALATGTLMLLWLAFDALTSVSDHITIDHDLAAGLRLGGFLLACGLILGRAVAGDWVSAGQTVSDFVFTGWPAAVLFAAAVAIDRAARPTPARPVPDAKTYGVLPALVYVGAAAFWVATLGLPQ
jgi:uncharacterized membrane protein YjfL (UPF0719 family)